MTSAGTTIFCGEKPNTLSSSNGFTARQVFTIAQGNGGTKVRVTFISGTSGMATKNCSIGVKGGTNFTDTTATPIELLFSGVSGFSMSANSTLVSDWATLAFAATDSLVVIMDLANSGANYAYSSPGQHTILFSTSIYYELTATSYTLSTVANASLTSLSAENGPVLLVETDATQVNPYWVNSGPQNSQPFGTTLTPVAPTQMVTGNLLVIYASATSAVSDLLMLTPSGWNLIRKSTNFANDICVYLFAAICTGAAMAMPTLSWTGNNSVQANVAQYTGNAATIGSAIGASNDAHGSSSPTVTNPGLTTTNDSSLVVLLELSGVSYISSPPPSGYNNEWLINPLGATKNTFDVPIAVGGNSSSSVSTALHASAGWVTFAFEIVSFAPPVTKNQFVMAGWP